MLKARTDLRNLTTGIVLLFQTALGILGNFFLLFAYLIIYFNEHTLKVIYRIFIHVFISNSLTIISVGIPAACGAFGWNLGFSHFGCKLLSYVQRLARSVSISTTCVLSVFWVITINPRNNCWKEFKIKTTEFVGLYICLSWILLMLVNMLFPVYTTTNRNLENVTQMGDFHFCYSVGRDKTVDLLYIAFCMFPEVLFSVLLVCSSIFMIVILYGHKKRVQHTLHAHASIRTSAEIRAIQNILILVCTFLVFYTLSSILLGYIAILDNPSGWLINITAIISMSFPTLCPFVIGHDFTVSRFCFT
ncbi:vomeronasal type-1 receptor 2-like [Apodemus sylvaticus]|uniref:vomeronasal type-1 receptor 2-like n=1 Tax=Apodemus sylvaticus TaxID=10129 RepID=UPI0022444C49|nr:vomeronasal type-1 receptor 2-like [Apodemus sylvaticus]